MRDFIFTYWPFFGFALAASTGFILGRLTAPRWILDDGVEEPQPWEIKEDLTKEEEEEVDRIEGGFGESIHIARSPLIKFRDPLGIAATEWDTAILPVVEQPEGDGKLGFWGNMLMLWMLIITPRTFDANPYNGRHRTDGMTKREKDTVNTTTMLIPILEYMKPNSLTMEMPWLREEVFA